MLAPSERKRLGVGRTPGAAAPTEWSRGPRTQVHSSGEQPRPALRPVRAAPYNNAPRPLSLARQVGRIVEKIAKGGCFAMDPRPRADWELPPGVTRGLWS